MQIKEQFIEFCEQYGALSVDEKEFLKENIPIKSFDQGTLLLSSGQIMKDWYLVMKGCVRSYFLKDGNEITTGFYDEGRVVNSWHSFLHQEPAKHFLECIEKCQLVCVNLDLDSAGFSSFAKFDYIGRVKLGYEIAVLENSIIDLLTLSAQERYIKFTMDHPKLVQRIPLKKIASYLGIRPETLSRIRRNLAGIR